MGLNEHQWGHETPKTLFNALRLSPPRGVIAHVRHSFQRVATPKNSRISGQRSRDRPRWPSFGDKKRAETPKFLPPRPLRPVSNTFRRVAELEKTRISGQSCRKSPRWATFCQETQNRPAKFSFQELHRAAFSHANTLFRHRNSRQTFDGRRLFFRGDMRVNVHRQLDVRVPCQKLRRLRRHARPAQIRNKRVPQAVTDAP